MALSNPHEEEAMSRTLKTTVKALFGAAVVGALGLGATQAVAAPPSAGERAYCYPSCEQQCDGNPWICAGGECFCG